ncbi:hypothetical protein MOOTH_00430 [Moorella thermoacetica]|nr:hypothetical protein MOOTH_00430 [Moorella thermoacetica]
MVKKEEAPFGVFRYPFFRRGFFNFYPYFLLKHYAILNYLFCYTYPLFAWVETIKEQYAPVCQNPQDIRLGSLHRNYFRFHR